MDIARTPPNRTRRRVVVSTLIVIAAALATLGVSRLEPAPPTVDGGLVWTDKVQRGPMVRAVRGSGSLVPEEVRWVSATSSGRVERLLVETGAVVAADTVLLELSNPELRLAALDASLRLEAAEADVRSLRVELQHAQIDRRAQAAAVAADLSEARLNLEANEQLAAEGLVGAITLQVARVRVNELELRNQLETQRLESGARARAARLEAESVRLEQLRVLAQLRATEVANLRVTAGTAGVLQQLPVEPGQLVAAGTVLAKVAEPSRLKAELRIAQTQARDIQRGQPAVIDTRNGKVDGRVVRIDPAVQNGTVTVDVAIEGELPRGARPDLTVEGTIELERLDDVLFVGRPAFAEVDGKMSLYRLVDGGREAVRVAVEFGRSSVHVIEITGGLSEGDEVILSDMSSWSEHDRVRIR